MKDFKYKVYVKLDENKVIRAINSSCFLQDTTGWIVIDEGVGDKFAHAQGHYLPLGTYDSKGRNNYKLVDKTPIELTEEEKETLFPTPKPQPTELDKLEARLTYLEIMSEVIYYV